MESILLLVSGRIISNTTWIIFFSYFFTWKNSLSHCLYVSVIVSYLYLCHTLYLHFYCYDYSTMSPIKGQDNQLCARLYSLFPSLTTLSFSVINLSLTVGIVPMSIHIFPGYSSIKTRTCARPHTHTHTHRHSHIYISVRK